MRWRGYPWGTEVFPQTPIEAAGTDYQPTAPQALTGRVVEGVDVFDAPPANASAPTAPQALAHSPTSDAIVIEPKNGELDPFVRSCRGMDDATKVLAPLGWLRAARTWQRQRDEARDEVEQLRRALAGTPKRKETR
jgi:hypothetical protein